MPVPKSRRTSSSARRRRSHSALKTVSLLKCPKCSKPVKPHTACQFCGSYKGKEVLKIKDKSLKNKKS